eukprot:gene3934-7144_t
MKKIESFARKPKKDQKSVDSSKLQKSYNITLEKYERKKGDLKVSCQVIQAKNICGTDVFGKSNPYVCVFVMGGIHPRTKTKVIKKSTSPKWNELVDMDVENFKNTNRNVTIRFEIYNWQQVGNHEFLGCHTIYLRDHPELFNANGKWIEMWLVLKKRTSNDKTVSGKIHIGLKVDKGIEIDELKKMKEDIRNKKGLPMADPRRTKLSGPGVIDGKPKVDIETHFTITPILPDGTPCPKCDDEWFVDLKSSTGNNVDVKLTPSDDGSHLAKYTPNEPGNHELTINLNDKPIADKPFDIYIQPSLVADQCEVYGYPLEPNSLNFVGHDCTVHVQAVDKFGNHLNFGGDKISCKINTPSPHQTILKDNNNGVYDITFNPKQVGKYRLFISMNEQLISEEGFYVKIQSKPFACIEAPELSTEKPFIATDTIVSIQLVDKDYNKITSGGENFNVIIKYGSQPVVASIIDNHDGTYSAIFMPERKGSYSVDIFNIDRSLTFEKDLEVNSKPRLLDMGRKSLKEDEGFLTFKLKDANGNVIEDFEQLDWLANGETKKKKKLLDMNKKKIKRRGGEDDADDLELLEGKRRSSFIMETEEIDWLLDADESTLTVPEKKKKKRLIDGMKRKIKGRGFDDDDDELAMLGVTKRSSFKMDTEELDWLLDSDESKLTVEEKKKKKKLVDGMKRKVKGRKIDDDDELEMLGVKSRSSFKMEAEELDWLLETDDSSLTKNEKKKKKKLVDGMKRKIKGRGFDDDDDELTLLGVTRKSSFRMEDSELDWLLEADESSLSVDEKKKKKKLVDGMRRKIKSRLDDDDDDLQLLGSSKRSSFIMEAQELDWLLDANDDNLSKEEKKKKKKLVDVMKRKIKERGLDDDDEDLKLLGVTKKSSFRMEESELDWLLGADEQQLSVDEKKKKKKLVDGVKRKIKSRNYDEEEELTMLAVKKKSAFKLDSDELDWLLEATDDSMTQNDKIKKKKLTDIMKRKIKTREFNDDELELLGVTKKSGFIVEQDQLDWLLDSEDNTLSDEEKKKKKILVDVLKNKMKGRNLDQDDELTMMGIKRRTTFLMDSSELDWLIDSEDDNLTEKDISKKRKLTELMTKKLKPNELNEEDLELLGGDMDDDELEFLVTSDENTLNDDQKMKKKKLIDLGKRKMKTKDLQEDELEFLGVNKKSTFQLDSDEIDWILEAPEDKLTEDEKKTKKKLNDTIKRKLKKRGLNDDDLEELKVEGSRKSNLTHEELDWLIETNEDEMDNIQKKQKKKLVDVMKKKIKNRSTDDDDDLNLLGVKKKTTFRLDSDELDWLMDSSEENLVETEKLKKKRLTDIMKNKIKKREFDDEDLQLLGIKDRNALKLESIELDWLLESDDDLLNDTERSKKKKLVDIMKNKLKKRDLDDDELKLLGIKKRGSFRLDSDELDWILDSDEIELSEEDKIKKKRLNEMMKNKLKKRDFDKDELIFLGISNDNEGLNDSEFDWLLNSDGSDFSQEQKNQKKKLIDMMKRKIKTRDLSLEDLKLLRGVKPDIGLDADELIMIMQEDYDKLTDDQKKKKKKLHDIMTTKLKKRDFDDDELKMLGAKSSLLSKIEEEELLWLMDSEEQDLSPENKKRRHTMVELLKKKIIVKSVEESKEEEKKKPKRKRRGAFQSDENPFDLDSLMDSDKQQIFLEVSGVGLQDLKLEDLLFAIKDSDGNIMEGFRDLDWVKNLKVLLKPTVPPLMKFYKGIPGKIYKSGEDDLKIIDVQGEMIHLDIKKDEKPYNLYTPDSIGLHQLKRGEKPEYFHVHDNPPDASKSKIEGPSKCNLFEKSIFEVSLYNKNGEAITSGNDDVTAIITFENEKKLVKVKDLNNGKYLIEHSFSNVGPHSIEVKLMGTPISNSPLNVIITKDISPYLVSRYVDIKLTNDNITMISSRKIIF